MRSLLPRWPRAMLKRRSASRMLFLGALAKAAPERIPAASSRHHEQLELRRLDARGARLLTTRPSPAAWERPRMARG